MRRRFHFAVTRLVARTRTHGARYCVLVLLAALPVCPVRCAAANATSSVGRIEGSDVSIDGAAVGVNSPDSGYLSNGSVVTVHEGQARLRLGGGGDISICGPAKFTLLQSGGAVTLALEFGRMHVEIPAAVSLRIFTPSIVATPLDIRGATRELTVGLDQNDSLCVIVSSGAVRLEQQLSGERVIIPEAGDFSLNGGQLIPVANSGRSCQCAATREALPAPGPRPPPQIASVAPLPLPAADASQPAAPEPPVAAPVHQIEVPLTFSASSSSAPVPTPTAETALLIREVQADPDWEFSGRVETSEFARDLSRSLGENGRAAPAASQRPAASTGATAAAQPTAMTAPPGPAAKPKPRRGIWAAFKSIF
jgi:hypothetical protein